MATTYEPIATTTLGSAQASVSFTSISGSFTDLVLVVQGKSTTATAASIRVNDATDYSTTRLEGNGSSALSDRFTAGYIFPGGGVFSEGMFIAHFMNYSNTTTYKTILTRYANPSTSVFANVSLWESTSAITKIEVMLNAAGNYDTGSTFTLYGIASA